MDSLEFSEAIAIGTILAGMVMAVNGVSLWIPEKARPWAVVGMGAFMIGYGVYRISTI